MASTRYVDENGDEYWENTSGNYHLISGPALRTRSGEEEWWVNGEQYQDGSDPKYIRACDEYHNCLRYCPFCDNQRFTYDGEGWCGRCGT